MKGGGGIDQSQRLGLPGESYNPEGPTAGSWSHLGEGGAWQKLATQK